MQEPRLDFVTCTSPVGLHRMAYWEWGDPDNDRVLLCVHGLTRTGRDFDRLARELSGQYRVVCPDVVGRGRSDWLANPAFYTVPQYVGDMVTLLARLQPATLAWFGTSMGGLIGLALAGAVAAARLNPRATLGRATPLLSGPGIHFDKMVLNDVGPRIEPLALTRIGEYVGQPQALGSEQEAVDYVRRVSAGFGPHSDEQWRELTRYVFVEQNGFWVKHYDLGIAMAAGTDGASLAAGEQILWQSFDAIDFPVLVVRGQQSDLFAQTTARQMLERNRHARLLELPGVGHAPTFMSAEQIGEAVRFLSAG